MFRPIRLVLISTSMIFMMAFRHPYHVAINTITWKKEAKTLAVEIKVFYHDVEPAVNKLAGTSIDIKNYSNVRERDSLVFYYVETNFKVSLDYNDVVYQHESIGFKDEYMTVKLSLQNVTAKSIMISNTMCYDTEPTQTNIFHFVTQQGKITRKTVNPVSEMEFKL